MSLGTRVWGQSTQNDVNNDLVVEPDGSINVNVQDQTSPPLDLYFQQAIGAPTQLTNSVAIDDNTMTVDSVANISVGNYVGVFCRICGRFYFGTVLAVNGLVVTLDTPFDYAFMAGENVISTTIDLAVDGTLADPSIFIIAGPRGETEFSIDITRINISIVSSDPPDDGKFGGIDALTNGIVLRRKDGDIRNIWNCKDNATLGILSGIDTVYSQRTVPQGSYGTKSRISYAGQEKHGVAIRLYPGDFLQLLVQDPLSALTSFKIMAQGHIVVP
jgi:hypothetical protein